MSPAYEALVVGGGPAGALVATALARAGRRVALLEREAGPHDKVCGEFLSCEAVLYLQALGLDLARLGAVPVDAVRLTVGERTVAVELPFRAFSLSRRTLDEALLVRAGLAGAEIRRGARVRALERRGEVWQARLERGDPVEAAATFLATGKHDLRNWRRPRGLQPDLIAFKGHWRLASAQAAALDRHIELTLFPGGYAGLEPVEGGQANLCLVVRRRRFAALGQRWEALLASLRTVCPLLDRRLADAEPCWSRPLALSAIPYGYVRRRSDGPWRLGDQAAVIPSFAGDGVAMALHSARLAADCCLQGGTAAEYQQRMAHDVEVPVRLATLISLMLVRSLGQTVFGNALRLRPELMAAVARATRVPATALGRAGLAIGG